MAAAITARPRGTSFLDKNKSVRRTNTRNANIYIFGTWASSRLPLPLLLPLSRSFPLSSSCLTFTPSLHLIHLADSSLYLMNGLLQRGLIQGWTYPQHQLMKDLKRVIRPIKL